MDVVTAGVSMEGGQDLSENLIAFDQYVLTKCAKSICQTGKARFALRPQAAATQPDY